MLDKMSVSVAIQHSCNKIIVCNLGPIHSLSNIFSISKRNLYGSAGPYCPSFTYFVYFLMISFTYVPIRSTVPRPFFMLSVILFHRLYAVIAEIQCGKAFHAACVGLTTDARTHNGVLVDGQNDAVVVVDVEDRQRPHPVRDTARCRKVGDNTDHVDKTLNCGMVDLFDVLHARSFASSMKLALKLTRKTATCSLVSNITHFVINCSFCILYCVAK